MPKIDRIVLGLNTNDNSTIVFFNFFGFVVEPDAHTDWIPILQIDIVVHVVDL